MNTKDHIQASKLTAIAEGCYGCSKASLRGVLDTQEKVCLAYVILECMKVSLVDVAKFLSINRSYLECRLKELTAQVTLQKEYRQWVLMPKVVFDNLMLIDSVYA